MWKRLAKFIWLILYFWGMLPSPKTPLPGRNPPRTPGMILIGVGLSMGVDLIGKGEMGLKDIKSRERVRITNTEPVPSKNKPLAPLESCKFVSQWVDWWNIITCGSRNGPPVDCDLAYFKIVRYVNWHLLPLEEIVSSAQLLQESEVIGKYVRGTCRRSRSAHSERHLIW